jgi:hypothetical protein
LKKIESSDSYCCEAPSESDEPSIKTRDISYRCSDINNKGSTNKEICNALGCRLLSEIEIELPIGNNKISISVCKNCLHKFK